MLKKIAVENLSLGMHIHEFCGSWMDHPFWRTKFVLEDPEDLRQIKACGIHELWIDVVKGVDIGHEVAGATKQEAELAIDAALEEIVRPKQVIKRSTLAEEVKLAANICAKSKQAVMLMFQEVRMGKAIDHAVAGDLVESISNSVLRNSGALISLARLKTADDYSYMHSVAVSALMVALAHQLELDDDGIRAAGMAGLLHDVGKAVMPIDVLNKPGKLTDQEFRIIKSHPLEGHRILLAGKTVADIPLDVCLHHHEKVDGSGYPHGLKDKGISLYAKMGAVCDVYDAITSNRPYKAGWDPAESIRKMAEWSKGHFDEVVFQAFVKSIGIYPTGSLVRLTSGRLAVVLEQSEKSLLTPRVKVFFSTKSQTYISPEVLDLSRQGANEKIVGREEAAKWGLKNIDQLWAA